MAIKIEGPEAKLMERSQKWKLLSPHLRLHGRAALSYATLQEGMEYFVDDRGYIAYNTIRHPVFALRPKRIVLSDPVCAPENLPGLIGSFLEDHPQAAFAVVSEECATALRDMGFKANCVGYEPELPIQEYNTQGNWNELDLVKRARNEARRQQIAIREVAIETVNGQELSRISAQWISGKKIRDREIWIYARRPVFKPEEEVRKFVAYDRDGQVAGFVFYDPIYRSGNVIGYSANIVRCDEQRFGRLATAIHMTAMDQFKKEGKEILNLLLAPFVKLNLGKYNDDYFTRLFFRLSERYGNDIYNFKGLSFHKSKYRGTEKPVYFVARGLFSCNDVYLAFLVSDIAQGYFSTLFRLFWGMVSAGKSTQLGCSSAS